MSASKILGADGRPIQRAVARPSVRAKYDVAQTTEENRKHWSMADALSADAAMAPGVREIIRKRSRYEYDNNSYVGGMVDFVAEDTVGSEIHLKINTSPKGTRRGAIIPTTDDAAFIERQWREWMEATGMLEELNSAYAAEVKDGESFVQMVTNPRLDVPVTMDLCAHEAEMVQGTEIDAAWADDRYNDGIWYDQYKNPVRYDLQRYHPGGNTFMSSDPIPVLAKDMCHLYWAKRPGQRRGVSEILAGLPLCAVLRRWTLAVAAAAETAADFAAVMTTDNVPFDDDFQEAKAFENLEIVRRMMMTLPAGYDIKQFKAEQPVTGYAEFKKELVAEFGNAIRVPTHLALSDSSSYNYSSVRMDNQSYVKFRKGRRSRLRRQCLDKIFRAWWREAVLVEGYMPQRLRSVNLDLSHSWIFEGDPHVDPVKEANAQAIRLANGTSTLAREWGMAGEDVESELDQIQREREALEARGINLAFVEVAQAAAAASEPDDEPVQATRLQRDEHGRLIGFERV